MKPIKTRITNKRAYVNNVPMNPGEVTLITSDSIEASMVHACRLGKHMHEGRLSTLVINCGMSKNRFETYFHDNDLQKASGRPYYIMRSSVRGNLQGDRESLDQIILEAGIQTIIIVGWEWASDTWRRKQKLLSYLREIMDEYNIAVIIYTHCYNAPKPGVVDRGGVGKLSLLAMFVVAIGESEHEEAEIPKPPIQVVTGDEDEAAERSVQLLISKINELQGEGKKISSSWDSQERDAEEMPVEV